MTGAILGPRSPINRSILNVCEDLEGVRGYKRALLYSFFVRLKKLLKFVCEIISQSALWLFSLLI